MSDGSEAAATSGSESAEEAPAVLQNAADDVRLDGDANEGARVIAHALRRNGYQRRGAVT